MVGAPHPLEYARPTKQVSSRISRQPPLFGAMIFHAISAFVSVLLFTWAQLDRDSSLLEVGARGVLLILQLAIVFIAAVAATIVYSDLWSKRQVGVYVLLSVIPPAVTVGGFMLSW